MGFLPIPGYEIEWGIGVEVALGIDIVHIGCFDLSIKDEIIGKSLAFCIVDFGADDDSWKEWIVRYYFCRGIKRHDTSNKGWGDKDPIESA